MTHQDHLNMVYSSRIPERDDPQVSQLCQLCYENTIDIVSDFKTFSYFIDLVELRPCSDL